MDGHPAEAAGAPRNGELSQLRAPSVLPGEACWWVSSRQLTVRRVVARGIDEALLLGLQLTSLVVAAFLVWLSAFDAEFDPEVETGYVGLAVAALVLCWLICVFYEIVAVRAGASVGKLLCGLRVVHARSGRRLSTGRSLLRWLVASSMQPTIWLLWIGGSPALVAGCLLAWRGLLALSVIASPTDEGFHDRVVGSRVVPIR